MTALLALPASIPSPHQGVWNIGPLPLRAYSLAIMAGIIVAIWIATRRWVERGGDADTVLEISFWAVPFGIVGGRIYHVISSPDAYFGPNGDPWQAFRVWEGGLGIWGAIAFGAVGAWIGARRAGVSLATYADAAAPGILVAQAIGRLGNWFNQELFGSPTTLPWGLRIDADSPNFPAGTAPGTLFHPTFLYELLWNLAIAYLIVRLDKRFRWGHGRVFWAYVFGYTVGRLWIELLRIDPAEKVLGLRLNVWTAIGVGVVALVVFIVLGRIRPGREASPELHPERRVGSAPEAEVATLDADHDDAADDDAAETLDDSADDDSDEAADGTPDETAEETAADADSRPSTGLRRRVRRGGSAD